MRAAYNLILKSAICFVRARVGCNLQLRACSISSKGTYAKEF